MTFGDSWAEDDDDDSERSSSDEESEAELERQIMTFTRDCIDSALAVLSTPVDETKSKVSSLPQSLRFDFPPSRPLRSKLSVERSASDATHDRFQLSKSDATYDRFQLSKSEHISQSFRAPRRPSRPSDHGEHNTASPECSRRASLDARLSSPRDVLIQPPSRRRSRERIPRSKPEGKSCRRCPRGEQITLRASASRVLLASRELSTSEHLRRSCPSDPTTEDIS